MASDSNVEILAERLRASNVMGRSESLKKLFEFLVARSADAVAPKEVEVAAAIFGAGANFDTSQDASVRVYIHRLRQKLDEYYDTAGQGQTERLLIPKGVGYRIQATSANPEVAAPVVAPEPVRRRWPHWAAAGAIGLLLAANLLAWVFYVNRPAPVDELASVRAASVWAPFLNDSRPITVVVGDYYIFEEIAGAPDSSRLVRDYTINSAEDLNNYVMQHPALMGHYVDLDLYYLPISIAAALRSVMPVLAPTAAARDRVRIVQASDLTPDMLKHNNIVYLGYLSGLGILKDLVFSGSRFSIGDTYDELFDNVSRHHYESQEGGPPGEADSKQKDYGYFSTFTGPNGNRIMVIAGTRDTAAMQTAETVTSLDSLNTLQKKSGNASSYEALYEVEGIQRMNLGGHLIVASPLRTDRIWNSQPADLQFPKG